MTPLRTFAVLCAFALSLPLGGCFTHNLPKDAFMQGAHSKIVTPWGTHELVIDMAATGSAAKNVTLPDAFPAPKQPAAPLPAVR